MCYIAALVEYSSIYMKALLRTSDILDEICGWVIVALFMLMTITYATQILLRYVFGIDLMWTEELTCYADIWAVMIGAAMIAKHRSHINVSVLEEYLPKASRAWLLVFQQLFSLVFFVAMFYFQTLVGILKGMREAKTAQEAQS